MRPRGSYIAIDWGTTNRRALRIGGSGIVQETIRDARGVLSVPAGGYQGEIAALRGRLGDLPVIASGMVGSSRGWREIPYVDAPADIATIGRGGIGIHDRVRLLPGVAVRDGERRDVMRGEEVLVLGAVAAATIPADALVCQPGTHSKWIVVEGGAIRTWTTAMTGELFGLLRRHGMLAGLLDGAVSDGPDFRAGLTRGATVDLAAGLFEVRAAVVTGSIGTAQAAARTSGLLIGSDVAARDVGGRTVHLLASGRLADLYGAAIEAAGGSVVPVDAEAAFAVGIHAIGGAA